MRKLIPLFLFVSSVATAAPVGPYMSLDAGYASLNTTQNNIFGIAQPAHDGERVVVNADIHTTGGAGASLKIGYNFSPRFGIDFSLSHTPSSDYEKKECSLDNTYTCRAVAEDKFFIAAESMNIVGNFYQPLFGDVEARFDAGVALVQQTVMEHATSNDPNFIIPSSIPMKDDVTKTYSIRPVAGVALLRVFANGKYTLGFEWERVFSRGSLGYDGYVPEQNLFEVTLQIHGG